MENGIQNGAHTNHERDLRANGVNGTFVKSEPNLDKGKDKANGGHDSTMQPDYSVQKMQPGALSPPNPLRMNDLPDEIQHITTDIMPLSLLLSRLAQISHNHIQELVAELATRPVASNAMNGSPDYRSTTADDTSPDSLEKKRMILNFIQDLHAKWVKALVITEWSRKAELVGKLIDLKAHIEQQLYHYTAVMWEMASVKRDLVFARLPSPDLKTALEVLSSGEVSWMPEIGFIDPPPLTTQDQLAWIDNLNTMLSVRLSLDDYDNIPYQFRDYSISSGRVTFKVAGEFEVDLTIADEDFEKQFWFIDFRFLFTPAPTELSDGLRAFLETKVNDILATRGLAGCYHFLHGFVLTHKITEFTRQAEELSRGRWTDSLKIERLNRSMAIQYWAGRPSSSPRSWIILGVHTGNEADGGRDAKTASHLTLRWFRDNKEVKDCDIPFDSSELSTEGLLKTIIARHIEYVLSSIHRKLLSFPRFRNREASLSLSISKTDPMLSELVMRLSHAESLTVRMVPTTGSFSFSPQSRIVQSGERNLNMTPKDPVDEGFIILEKTRCYYASEELTRRGKSMGWVGHSPPVKPDELKPLMNTRDPFHSVWLKRQGWGPEWFVLVTMGLGGDRWWLVEVTNTTAPVRRIRTFSRVTLTSGQPNLTDTFFDSLTVFVTGMISQLADLRVLYGKRIRHSVQDVPNFPLPPQIKMPAVSVRLSELVPSLAARSGSWRPWAMDFVQLMFKGAQRSGSARPTAGNSGASKNGPGITVVVEAKLAVTDRSKFNLLRANVDHDVTFNPRLGQFALRLRAEAGKSIIDSLATRLQAIARLVEFVDTMRRSGKGIVCESVTLRQVVFTYGDIISSAESDGEPPQQQNRWKVWLDLASGPNISIKLEKKNPHLRVLDKLKELANSSALKFLPALLNLTLPLLRGVDAIENSWAPIAMNCEGSVEIFHQSLDDLTLRYKLPGPPNQPRQLKLRLSMRMRKGERWWHLRPDGATADAENEFNKALKPIWNNHGDGWRGLGSGAAANPASGIEPLLSAVDSAVRNLVGSAAPAPAPAPTSFAESASSATTAPSTTRFTQSSGMSQPRPSQTLTQPSSQSQNSRNGGKAASPIVVLD